MHLTEVVVSIAPVLPKKKTCWSSRPKTVNRTVFLNLQEKRIWVPELGSIRENEDFRQGPAYDQQERCFTTLLKEWVSCKKILFFERCYTT